MVQQWISTHIPMINAIGMVILIFLGISPWIRGIRLTNETRRAEGRPTIGRQLRILLSAQWKVLKLTVKTFLWPTRVP